VNRRIMMFAGGAAFALLAVWFLLLWSPKGSELSAAKERKTTAEQKVSELQLKLARLQDAQRREPELQATNDRLASAVPAEPQLAQFILDVNDAATKAAVDFVAISPSPVSLPKIAGQPSVVTVKLTVSGDYHATLDFLDRLADLSRVLVLDEVNLIPTSDGSKLDAELGGNIFTTRIPTPQGATTAPTATNASTTTTTVKP
jgi:Tfp pilus assembly protein PilO